MTQKIKYYAYLIPHEHPDIFSHIYFELSKNYNNDIAEILKNYTYYLMSVADPEIFYNYNNVRLSLAIVKFSDIQDRIKINNNTEINDKNEYENQSNETNQLEEVIYDNTIIQNNTSNQNKIILDKYNILTTTKIKPFNRIITNFYDNINNNNGFYQFSNGNINQYLKTPYKKEDPENLQNYNLIYNETIIIPLKKIINTYNLKFDNLYQSKITELKKDKNLPEIYEKILNIVYSIYTSELNIQNNNDIFFDTIKKFLPLIEFQQYQNDLNYIFTELYNYNYNLYPNPFDKHYLEQEYLSYIKKFNNFIDIAFNFHLLKCFYLSSKSFEEINYTDALPLRALLQSNSYTFTPIQDLQSEIFKNIEHNKLLIKNLSKNKNKDTIKILENQIHTLVSKLLPINMDFMNHISFNCYLGFRINHNINTSFYNKKFEYIGLILSDIDVYKNNFKICINLEHNRFSNLKDINIHILVDIKFIQTYFNLGYVLDLYTLKHLFTTTEISKYPVTLKCRHNFNFFKDITFDKEKNDITKQLQNNLDNKLNIKLFDYQKANVLWMHNLEDTINKSQITTFTFQDDKEIFRELITTNIFMFNRSLKREIPLYINKFISISNLDQDYILKINSYNDSEKIKFCINYLENNYNDNLKEEEYAFIRSDNCFKGIIPMNKFIEEHTKKIEFNGGILADDVGLGKTASIVSHIINQFDNDMKKYQTYHKNLNEFLAVVDENDNNVIDPLDIGFEYNNLIIVPSRLTDQWVTEIEKYIKDKYKLRVKTLVSITNIRNLEKEIHQFKENYEKRALLYDKSKGEEYILPKTKGKKKDTIIEDQENIDIDQDITTKKKIKISKKNNTTKTKPTIFNDFKREYLLNQLYDVYIVSMNLLDNETYLNYINIKEGNHIMTNQEINHNTDIISKHIAINENITEITPDIMQIAKRKAKLESIRKHILNQNKISKYSNTFDIFRIKWNRIIIDEIHEKLFVPIKVFHNYEHHQKITNNDDQYLYERLSNLNANYKWGLSGTPLDKGEQSLAGILQFLTKKKYNLSYEEQLLNIRLLINIIGISMKNMDKLLNTIFKKTYKNEVKDTLNIPIFTEEIIYIDQTNIERNIYNSIRASNHFTKENKIKRLFLMCTNILINEGYDLETDNDIDTGKILTLEQLNANMIEKYKNQLHKITEDLDKYNHQQIINDTKLNAYLELVKYITSLNIEEKFEENVLKELENKFGNFLSKVLSREAVNIFLQIINSFELYNNPDTNNLGQILINCLDDIKISVLGWQENWNNLESLLYCSKLGAKLGEYYCLNDKTKLNRKIDLANTEIKRINNQISLFSNNEFLKEKTADPCIICFMDLNEIVVTPCRHIFCIECCNRLSNNMKNTFNCPECRNQIQCKELNITNIDMINGKKNSQENTENTENIQEQTLTKLQELLGKEWKMSCINKYGSKMGYLVEYLYNLFDNPENRVIIFSQYDKMLKMIGKTLDEFKIKYVYCTGNNFVLNKNINKFKKDKEYRVIMLSSETSNSGSNLTEANHIIFIDALFQNPESTKDVEAQAIGRAVRLGQKLPVKVIRFITRNTVEEEHFIKYRYNINTLQE